MNNRKVLIPLSLLSLLSLIADCSAQDHVAVSGSAGGRAVLPCSYTPTRGQDVAVTWHAYPDQSSVLLIDSETSAPIPAQWSGRVKLSDEVSSGNASLLISELRLEDTRDYTCTVQINGKCVTYRNIKLTVQEPPKRDSTTSRTTTTTTPTTRPSTTPTTRPSATPTTRPSTTLTTRPSATTTTRPSTTPTTRPSATPTTRPSTTLTTRPSATTTTRPSTTTTTRPSTTPTTRPSATPTTRPSATLAILSAVAVSAVIGIIGAAVFVILKYKRRAADANGNNQNAGDQNASSDLVTYAVIDHTRQPGGAPVRSGVSAVDNTEYATVQIHR
ncbi:salivary glue protein Sgs-3-like [Acipenser ruthenus]|uniref:salivary glue protein Sgs-3-like n=1 Tax=Acipenser ruthenus TaxID=7906 RepID=UPI0027424707|nr:salivary glue protein Sgs-3-like [Acipenser ruthenus]